VGGLGGREGGKRKKRCNGTCAPPSPPKGHPVTGHPRAADGAIAGQASLLTTPCQGILPQKISTSTSTAILLRLLHLTTPFPLSRNSHLTQTHATDTDRQTDRRTDRRKTFSHRQTDAQPQPGGPQYLYRLRLAGEGAPSTLRWPRCHLPASATARRTSRCGVDRCCCSARNYCSRTR